MFVGGGSAGTAGGLKVTTLLVLWHVMVAEVRGERTVFAVDGDPRTSDDALRFLLTRTDARDVETLTHGLEEAFLQLTEEKA